MKSPSWQLTTCRFGFLLICASALAATAQSTEVAGLFDSDEILNLTLRGPKDTLMREAAQRPTVEGTIGLAEGTSIPITATTYGESRLEVCPVPLLKIMTEPDDSRGTLFEGQDTLWLVTRCRTIRGYEKFVVLEYLVYQSYAVLARPALRSRLVSFDVRDTDGRFKDQSAYAFLLEDIGLAAARHGMTWLDVQGQFPGDVDPGQGALLSLFQYMVGNTDWSALSAEEGTRCCHNTALLRGAGDDHNTVLPFDFDQCGMVNPPYASPDPRIGISRVTQRSYRGLCQFNDRLPDAVALFNAKRPEIRALLTRNDLPYPKARAGALKYIESFYEIINDPEKFEKRIVGECRN